MPDTETVQTAFGPLTRTRYDQVPSTLRALPLAHRPKDATACASCPDAAWYVTDVLLCHCAARRYVSWTKAQTPVMLCDDREAAIARLGAEENEP